MSWTTINLWGFTKSPINVTFWSFHHQSPKLLFLSSLCVWFVETVLRSTGPSRKCPRARQLVHWKHLKGLHSITNRSYRCLHVFFQKAAVFCDTELSETWGVSLLCHAAGEELQGNITVRKKRKDPRALLITISLNNMKQIYSLQWSGPSFQTYVLYTRHAFIMPVLVGTPNWTWGKIVEDIFAIMCSFMNVLAWCSLLNICIIQLLVTEECLMVPVVYQPQLHVLPFLLVLSWFHSKDTRWITSCAAPLAAMFFLVINECWTNLVTFDFFSELILVPDFHLHSSIPHVF